jgi:benzoate-CoA ligase
VAKLFFAYGIGNSMFFPLSVGAAALLEPSRPSPDLFARRASEDGATLLFGTPSFWGPLLASNVTAGSFATVRQGVSAGEAMPPRMFHGMLERFGVEVLDGIGSTEMLHIFISNRPGDIRYGTTGRPVEGYAIELRGEDGNPVPVGEVGDLYIKGPSTAVMYWGNPEKSAETFREGWTKSGDKYSRDADGYYTYAGRSDDMLKVSGIYVSPFEVEATLMQHPAVLEAAVIGKEDADGLTKTKAYVVLKSGQSVTDDELKGFVKERLAPYKYPRFIEFVDELPKTATGKIQRFRLREREREA